MKECILLFHFEQTKARKLVTQLMMLKFKVKVVKEEEWRFPLGVLCGNMEVTEERSEEDGKKDLALTSPMLVMAGVDGSRLNQVLTAIKKSGIGPVPYKAVVTETNQHWLPCDLLEELRQEHEKMQSMENDGKMIHES